MSGNTKSIRMKSVPTSDKEFESRDIYKADDGVVEGRPPSRPSKPKSSRDLKESKELPNLDELEGNPLTQDASNIPSPPPKKSNRNSVERGETPKSRGSQNLSPTKSPPAKSDAKHDPSTDRFKGTNILQYALWAHYMSIGAVALCLSLGIFAILWVNPKTYDCHVEGKPIFANYRLDSNGFCNNTIIIEATGLPRTICCDPSVTFHSLKGNKSIGAVYVIYSIVLLLLEEPTFGFGLWYPNDSIFYKFGISPCSVINLIIGAAGFVTDATMLAGACLIILACVQAYAARRGECGDGGRKARETSRAKAASEGQAWYQLSAYTSAASKCCTELPQWNPYTFFVRIYNEDKLSTYVWLFLYFASNVVLFVYIIFVWVDAVEGQYNDLLNGTLELTCNTPLCKMNRKILRYGPLSPFAAFAKACGGCLNYNCALLLLPVTKALLRKINNAGVSFSNAQHSTDIFAKFFARPLTRYIPLQKNIEFHKLVAWMVFYYSWGHMIMHYLNLIWADAATVTVFTMFGWVGSAWLTGTIVSIAMFFIYSAAPDVVRHAKFEIFFYSHHMFTVFFLLMFLHGPVFFYWTCIPVCLYLYERYTQTLRGKCPFVICKVEWIAPVMAVYFRPVFKEDFVFKEGQYLYLNCPHISAKEWHPFTISSAYEDLDNGPRVHLVTGEEVVEVPKPNNLPPGAKWNKYCPASVDWRTLSVHQLLDKSETGYMDYISVHIKVHGLDDPVPRSWTRKFKEYLELINTGNSGKFPFYFCRRDHRGDITIGKQFGPDGLPIICVDGPHSAPSEHYTSYGTVMLVGAGIGLTPCASIITALTKYRWRKNFNPEIVHFYWVVRQNEVDSFQWLVHLLTEIQYEMKKGRETHQIEKKYYSEINIYVTAADKSKKLDVKPLQRSSKELGVEESRLGLKITPSFTADQLYAEMLNPSVDSKGQIQKMKLAKPSNRFQDIWVWNGRPQWDEVFKEMREQRQHSDIGVCFCGAPAIGADLQVMCEKYSSVREDCIFTLHKENF